MATQIMTAPGQPESLSPGHVRVNPLDILGDALVNRVATLVPTIYNDRAEVRVPFLASTQTAGFVPEGTEIPETKADIAEVVVKTRKIALLHSISNEMLNTLDESGNAAEMLTEQSLRKSVISAADKAFITNADTPIGLGQIEGATEAGALSTNLDTVIDAVATIEADGGLPSEITAVAHPLDWAKIAKIKQGADSNIPLVVPTPVDTATRNIAGIPVHVNPNVAQGEIIFSDRSNIVASSTMIELEADQSALFALDSTLYRCKLRLGWNVLKPARIVKMTIPS